MGAAGAQPTEEVADAVGDGSAERKGNRDHGLRSVADGARRGDGVQLICVVEDGSLGRS